MDAVLTPLLLVFATHGFCAALAEMGDICRFLDGQKDDAIAYYCKNNVQTKMLSPRRRDQYIAQTGCAEGLPNYSQTRWKGDWPYIEGGAVIHKLSAGHLNNYYALSRKQHLSFLGLKGNNTL